MARTTEANHASSRQGSVDAEADLHALFMCGLGGDAPAYQAFLQNLGAHLRAFLRRRLFGWPDEVEDPVQDCLIAIHDNAPPARATNR